MLYYNQKREREDKTMTKQEIEKRIEEIEDRIWWINMADRYTYEDRQILNKLYKELRKLREELKKA